MRRLCLFALLVLAASSPALTFQFVSKSSRKILVPTEYKALSETTINQFFVIGEVGNDILLERIDRFANQNAQAIYDGPGLGDETVLDVAVDNFNQPVVLYKDGAGASRIAKFEVSLGNIYDVPVGSNDNLLQLHRGLNGTIIAGGTDSNGDIVLKKFATNGSVVWRTVVLENGSTDFRDMAVGPGEEVAVSGGNNEQGLIARLRGSDGARTATFLTAVAASAANRIVTIAFAKDTGFLFGAGFQGGASTAYRITTATNAKIEAAITSFNVADMNIAAGPGGTPKVVVAGSVFGGMRLALLSPGNLEASIGVETHPQNPGVFIPNSGTSIFTFGDAGNQLAIPNVLARFDTAGLRTSSVEAFTDSDSLVDAVPFFEGGILAAGRSEDANGAKVGFLTAADEFGKLFRLTEQRTHHPKRALVDAEVDSVGAHYQLTGMNGAVEAPFVVKHSATGQQIWGAQLSFPGLPFLRAIAMAIGPNGHPVIVCTGKATADPTSGQWVLFQLNNSNGSVRWSKIVPIGDAGTGAPADLAVHTDNSIGVVGRVRFFGPDSNFASARLATNGTIQWTRIFLSAGPDRLDTCRFLPNGFLVATGRVGGASPEALQLLTYNLDGGIQHQSIINEPQGTPFPQKLDVEPSGNIVVGYGVFFSVPVETRVRRMNPLTGATLATCVVPTSALAVAVKASPDGNVWVSHIGADAKGETFRMNGTTGAISQVLDFPATAGGPIDMAVRSDNSVVVATTEFTGSVVNTLLLRRLATGGQAALRRLAGAPATVRNAPGTALWVGGDVLSRNRGAEQYAAKYTVP